MDSQLSIKLMTEDVVRDVAAEWAAKEGWNPGTHDYYSFYNCCGKNNFFVGYLNNEPVAIISAVVYTDTYGFIGFYIVDANHRGKGFGITMWQHAMEHLSRGCNGQPVSRNIGLDGVPEQQSNYKKSGFSVAYQSVRMSFNFGDPQQFAALQAQQAIVATHEYSAHLAVNVPFSDLLMYDEAIFGCNRESFLRCWLLQPENHVVIVINSKSGGDGPIIGMGGVRPCRNGYRIGPLFADSTDIASFLLEYLLQHANAQHTAANSSGVCEVCLDIPDSNTVGMELLQNTFGLKPGHACARMYTQSPPNVPIEKNFAHTTIELG